ncbi:MAG: 3-hydroxybutyrate oligomer hydrolase family protein [Burkholderiales bacterium]|nr:3-hydroxybutyrate oligomer hydrolase family protein [Burkholderiales bacterium]
MRMRTLSLAMTAAIVAACGSDPGLEFNAQPSFIRGPIERIAYDGTNDDLLTAGLGRTGLANAASPTIADANAPTAPELRRLAIHQNYRALVDTTASGGFGTLFGPNVTANGTVTTGEGRIAGVEYMAYSDDGSGRENVTLLVQIPANFNREQPCIVTAPSSGSRGVYGAIAVPGEWGLKRGCAVAYTDKGTGNGAHDLASNTVFDMRGRAIAATAANAAAAQFVSDGPTGAAANNRIAFKHAHSRRNPEKDWGRYTLEAIRFAFFALNEEFGERVGGAATVRFRPDNTLVIAAGVSNGGGAALMAAEQDRDGLIDAVVVAEPQIQPDGSINVTVRVGNAVQSSIGRALFDYSTQALLYQPCAALAPSLAAAPALAFINRAAATNRCASLASRGLLSATTTDAQAEEALGKLRAAGWSPEADLLHASHFAFAVPAIAVTYANTYAAAGVADNLCGFGFAATGADGRPTAIAPAAFARLFGTGNGIPPTSGINLVNFANPGGPIVEGAASASAGGVLDYNLDGARCLAGMLNNATVQANIRAVQRSGKLQGKPTIIVHGRADALVPVNHSSRPYVAQALAHQGSAAKLAYIELTNVQHFDAFIGNPALAGYDTRFVPILPYMNRALDAMWAHLTTGQALPPSQVVRTIPRGGAPGSAPALTAANLPAWSASPAAADTITFSGTTLTVPQ